jgi:hypothetical protein
MNGLVPGSIQPAPIYHLHGRVTAPLICYRFFFGPLIVLPIDSAFSPGKPFSYWPGAGANPGFPAAYECLPYFQADGNLHISSHKDPCQIGYIYFIGKPEISQPFKTYHQPASREC